MATIRLGGQYGVPHGLANAIILPYMLKEYGKTAYEKLSKLAKISLIAENSDTEEVAAKKFIAYIEDLNKYFGIPTFVKELKEEDFDVLAGHADKEANPLYPVPKLMDKNELKVVYRKLLPNSEK